MSEETNIQGRVTKLEERLHKLEQADAENRKHIETILAQRQSFPSPFNPNTSESTPSEVETLEPPNKKELLPPPSVQREEVPLLVATAPKLEQDTAVAQRGNQKNITFQNLDPQEHEKIAAKIKVKEEELNALQEKLRRANEELIHSQAALSTQKRANEKLALERSDQATLLQRVKRELDQTQKNHQGAIKEYEALMLKIEKERHTFESNQLQVKDTLAIRERIWPPWMLSPEFAKWREDLEKSVLCLDSPPATGLLFAAIHSYNAATRDSDPKTLIDSLRDIGRRLYAWLRDRGLSEEEAADVSEEWGKAINQHCAGAATVDIPKPGNAAEVSWMSFQPRGGSAPDVISVRNWCVRDSQSRPSHRAEVIV